MITSSLFNFFKSFRDSFRFAFLFRESSAGNSPHCSSEITFSYHISNQTLVLKYLSFLIDFGVLDVLTEVFEEVFKLLFVK